MVKSKGGGDFESYLDVFIADAKRYGLDLSRIDTKNYQFDIFDESEIPFSTHDQTGEKYKPVALAYFVCSDKVRIDVRKDYCESGNADGLLRIMWHELGHTPLGYHHLYQYGQIMSGRHQAPQLPEGQTDKDKDWSLWWPIADWERQMHDFFTGQYQVQYDCRNNKGNGMMVCDIEPHGHPHDHSHLR